MWSSKGRKTLKEKQSFLRVQRLVVHKYIVYNYHSKLRSWVIWEGAKKWVMITLRWHHPWLKKKNKQRNSSCSFYYHILSNSADRTGFIAGDHFTCVLWSDGHWSHPHRKLNQSAKIPVYLVRFNTKELNYTGSV